MLESFEYNEGQHNDTGKHNTQPSGKTIFGIGDWQRLTIFQRERRERAKPTRAPKDIAAIFATSVGRRTILMHDLITHIVRIDKGKNVEYKFKKNVK